MSSYIANKAKPAPSVDELATEFAESQANPMDLGRYKLAFVSFKSAHAALQSEITALKAELAEARKDSERLEWLCNNGAYMTGSRDGDYCWLMLESDDEECDEEFEPQKGKFDSCREAIDAAMSAEKGKV